MLRDGQAVTLTPTEFDLLALLSASPGRVISRTEMIQKVWGQGADLDLRSVDAHVYRLRRKIEPDGPRPTYIHAVPGIGYRFERRGLTDRLSRAQDDGELAARGGGRAVAVGHGDRGSVRPAACDRGGGGGAGRSWASSTHWPRSLSPAGRTSTIWLATSDSGRPWGSTKSRHEVASPSQRRRSDTPSNTTRLRLTRRDCDAADHVRDAVHLGGLEPETVEHAPVADEPAPAHLRRRRCRAVRLQRLVRSWPGLWRAPRVARSSDEAVTQG